MINIIEECEEDEIYVDEIYNCYCMECKKIKDRKDRTWSKYTPSSRFVEQSSPLWKARLCENTPK